MFLPVARILHCIACNQKYKAMKNMKKALLMLALALSCGAYSSMAQIVVRVRPERPHYERTTAPSANHVWIDEEWEPRGNTYAFTGGHWAEPAHHGDRWAAGHWNKSRRGSSWSAGHWRH